MRRGQSTLEYILLIGIAAAALIAILVYVSRGLQGNLRNKADQLGAGQYAPGNTTISNSETKTLTSNNSSESSTTTVYGNMNEPNKALEAKMEEIQAKTKKKEEFKKAWELLAVSEAKAGAAAVRGGEDWKPPVPGLKEKMEDINKATNQLNDLNEEANKLEVDWPKRTPDKTSSKSNSSESGTVETHKYTNETLGGL